MLSGYEISQLRICTLGTISLEKSYPGLRFLQRSCTHSIGYDFSSNREKDGLSGWFFTVNAVFPSRSREKVNSGVLIPTCLGDPQIHRGRRYTRVILLDLHVPKSADTSIFKPTTSVVQRKSAILCWSEMFQLISKFQTLYLSI